jgi:aryl-alcohol dehydrogenase-like predicted oxidoreductase
MASRAVPYLGTTNVKLSPIALGGISLGNSWSKLSGRSEDPFALIDAYYELGGNFIATANKYNPEESEKIYRRMGGEERSARRNGSCDTVRGRAPCTQSRERATAK